jgi:hypothetical protein
MAILYITELIDLGKTQSTGVGQFAEVPAQAEQTVAISTVSARSAPFNVNTRFVRLCADVTCALAFGAAPVAAVSTVTAAAAPGTMRLCANVPEYFNVRAIAGVRQLAVIATT